MESKKDISKMEHDVKKGNNISEKNRKIIFWLFLGAGLIFLIIFLAGGVSVVLFIFIILWGVVLYFLRLFMTVGAFSVVTVAVSGMLLFIISFFMMSYVPGDGGNISNVDNGGSMKQGKNEQFKIKNADGKINGVVEISKIQKGENKGKFFAVYHILLNDKIKENHCEGNNLENSSQECDGVVFNYTYAVVLKGHVDSERGADSLIDAYCNKETLPTKDLLNGYSYDPYRYDTCHDEDLGWANKTETFYFALSPTIFESYEDFLKANTFTIYDATKEWKHIKDKEYHLRPLDAIKTENEYRSYQFELEKL